MNNISNGYEDITVEVIDFNEHIAEHIWNCYRMTWKHLQNIPYNVNNKDVQKAIDDVIYMKALPMPREQALITFRINNISRVCLAQLTRQRESAFNVESQMPKPIEHNVILPLNIANSVFAERAKMLIEQSQILYDELIAADIPPQDARYITMHGQTTSLVYVVNINKFVSSFALRCENNLSDEINLVYRLCKKAILDCLEVKFANNEIDILTYKFYKTIISKADCAGSYDKVGKNTDKVFGNSFKRYPNANDDVDYATKNCDYDYKKSAWYLELQRLYKTDKSLLFVDEDKMIEGWSENA